ncbi:MAG TPA: ADP-ribosylglycohydrolase family protein [Planctomycetota bacterium]|nr:ADP-ribosylglycohydrolase family protein [Planctomycetota bacterium]
MNERARNAILGALVGDAAAMGLHWVYDVDEARRRGGAAPEFQPPGQYHARRRPGDFTHYGDHAVVVLESLAERGRLDLDDYKRPMLARFGDRGYDGYLDKATKWLVATRSGADDDQAGCFAKLAPILAVYLDDPERDARLDAAFRVTHDNDLAVECGLAAAAAIRAAILGANPHGAVAAAAERGGEAGRLARAALEAGPDHLAFAKRAGQACPVGQSLPVALHAALVGPDYAASVRATILAGGDSAGRLLVAGAIRGATDGVPEAWLARVRDRARIDGLLDRLLAR